jgi:hypothetical protein
VVTTESVPVEELENVREKVDIIVVFVVSLPWAACEKVLEHGAAEKPYSQVLLPQC